MPATQERRTDKALGGPKKNLVFRDFEGLNTQAARQAIKHGEFSWLENLIPIGHGNLKVVPDRSLALSTLEAGAGTAFLMASYNIAGTNYTVLFTDMGRAYQTVDDSAVLTQIGTGDGEFITGGHVAVAQWSNERILILDAKGYRSWDGTHLVHIGCVNAVTIQDAGSALVNVTVTFSAPDETSGVQATGHCIVIAGALSEVVIDEPGTGYINPPTMTFNPASTIACTAFLLNPTGDNVASFSGRAWLTSNRTWLFTAPVGPGAVGYNNFQLGQGAGSFISTDETLLSSIIKLLPANNFLYWTGDTSVNAIGDVQVNSNGLTVFSNPNLTDSIGSDKFFGAVISYYRSLLMMNKSGIYALYGATPIKVSDALDGIFPSIDFSVPAAIYAGIVTIENQLCAAFAFAYDDPVIGKRPLFAIYFNKKWFLASQGNDLVSMTGAYDGISHRLYATDGTNVYELFTRDDYPVPWRFETAYWDMDDVTRGKQVTKFGFEMNVKDSDGEIAVNIDTIMPQQGSSAGIDTEQYNVPVSAIADWINDFDEVVEWDNDDNLAVQWLGNGYFMIMADGEGSGHYIGISMASTNVRGIFYSAMLEYTEREFW